MPGIALPQGLEEKLDSLAADVKRWRFRRGVSLSAVVVCAVPVVLVLLDRSLQLSAWLRIGLLALGVGVMAASVWWFVFRWWKQPVPASALAAAIEKEFPHLSERLQTLVELNEHAEPGNGSKAMIAILVNDTLRRSKKLDFNKAAPKAFSRNVVLGAGTLALVAAGLFVVVGGNTESLRRLLLPWYSPPVDVPYDLKVSSKDVVVRRGEPVTLSAYLERTKSTGELPTSLTLTFRMKDGSAEKRLPMSGDEQAAFTLTWPSATEDFEYRIETPHHLSAWYTVSAVDAVNLADGSTVRFTAPAYATATVPERTVQGLQDLEALQHSTATLELKWNRKPVDVLVEWRATDAKPEVGGQNIPFELTNDLGKHGLKTSLDLPSDGTLKVTLFAEKGLSTTVQVPFRATPDAAPKFERAAGMPGEPREFSSTGTLELELAVTDDVAVAELWFDYAKQLDPEANFTTESITLPLGTKSTAGKVGIPLAGKFKVGESYRVRLRARDNRRMPELGLAPNEGTYPAGSWVTVRIVDNAKTLAEQDILANRNNTDRQLDEIRKQLQETRNSVNALAKQTQGQANFKPDQLKQNLTNQDGTRQTARQLGELADRTGTPAALAKPARETADQQLAVAEEELKKSNVAGDAPTRDEAMQKALRQLDAALDKLTELKRLNLAAANEQMDRQQLDELAKQQEALTKEIEQAKPEELKALAEKQKELQEKLNKLQQQSDVLNNGKAAADQARAEKEADNLQKLADRMRELDEAMTKTREEAKRSSLEELSKRQQKLGKDAAELGRKTQGPATVAQAQPLDRKSLEQAEELLKKNQPADALTEQEKAARELDRLAESLAKAAEDRRNDAKEAATQLHRWQQDLNRRTQDAVKQAGGMTDTQRKELTAEQSAIRKATERLKLPQSGALEGLQQAAGKKAADAANQLKQSGSSASGPMSESATALEELAKAIPTNKQRREEALKELDELRKKQDQLAKGVKEAADAIKTNPDDARTKEDFAKATARNAEQEDELRKKIDQLDTPGAENRRQRAGDAARQAADDLRKGLTQDSSTSQEQLKRELDKLKSNLEGKATADEKAGELARMQNDLTRNLKKTNTPEELQRLQRQQEEIGKKTNELKAPEAPAQLSDAQAATKAAQRSGEKQNPDMDELRKKADKAAEALDQLAERLNRENPEQRLERLAKQREAEADKANRAEASRPDLSRSADARKSAENDLQELKDTPGGSAQTAKKQLQDALEKLARQDEPDRAKDLQKQAADAARKLADAGRKNGDLKKQPGNESASADAADDKDPANKLPTGKAAQEARDLAKEQRDLRTDVAKAAERAAKGEQPKPNGEDRLGDAAKKQRDLAEQMKQLQQGEQNQDLADAAKQGQKAEQQLKAGDAEGAKKSAEDAAEKLRDGAKDAKPDTAKKANDLAQKQDDLAGQLEKATPDDQAQRQQRRLDELAEDADQAAKQTREAGKQQDPGSAKSKQLDKAADAAEQAKQMMQQAERHAKNGKANDAKQSRLDAEKKMEDAARQARGDKPGEGKASKQQQEAAEQLQQADQAMNEAAKQMGKGEGKPSAKASEQAAKSLQQARDQLAQGEGKGKGEGQGQGSGSSPGNGGGSASGELPSIVVQNLGKPWGELPGDVKSSILVELKAKYGDDYARLIKLYFEQLAEKK